MCCQLVKLMVNPLRLLKSVKRDEVSGFSADGVDEINSLVFCLSAATGAVFDVSRIALWIPSLTLHFQVSDSAM